jgi:hypothetical protein
LAFNGIAGAISLTGQLPWYYVVGYFAIAIVLLLVIGIRTKGFSQFSTLDWVFIGIGAAFAVVWQFFIGSFLGGLLPSGIATYVPVAFWGGQLFSMMVIAVLVRKPGVGMASFLVYTILGDLFHYGFSGEPVYFFYEPLTYGLFLDLMILFTRGNLMAVKSSMKASAESTGEAKGGGSSGKLVAIMALEGAIIGFLFAFPDPIIYSGFFGPFIYNSAPNWQSNFATLTAYLVSGIPGGAIAGVLSNRIARALGQ